MNILKKNFFTKKSEAAKDPACCRICNRKLIMLENNLSYCKNDFNVQFNGSITHNNYYYTTEFLQEYTKCIIDNIMNDTMKMNDIMTKEMNVQTALNVLYIINNVKDNDIKRIKEIWDTLNAASVS
jgi:hypothetical protein